MTKNITPPINTRKKFTRKIELIDAADWRKKGINSIRIRAAVFSRVLCFLKKVSISELYLKKLFQNTFLR
jgi:hypothetical protein